MFAQYPWELKEVKVIYPWIHREINRLSIKKENLASEDKDTQEIQRELDSVKKNARGIRADRVVWWGWRLIIFGATVLFALAIIRPVFTV